MSFKAQKVGTYQSGLKDIFLSRSMVAVPLLNFSDFERGNPAEKADFCRRLYLVFSEFGFVKIKNHTTPDHVIEDLFSWVSVGGGLTGTPCLLNYAQSKQFFGMPLQSKLKAVHPPRPNPHRGWSSVGQEKLSIIQQGKAALDLKVSSSLSSPEACMTHSHCGRRH